MQELAHEGARTAQELRSQTMQTMQDLAAQAAQNETKPPTKETTE